MVGDELGERFVGFTFRVAGRLTAGTLKLACKGFISAIKGMHNNIHHKGKQSIKSISNRSNGVKGVDVSKEELGGFHKIAEKYKLDYSLVRHKNDKHCYTLFVKEKDLDKLTHVVDDFVKDKTKNNNSLSEKLQKAKEQSINLQKAREEKSKSKNKDKTKEKAPAKVPEMDRSL